MKKIKRVLIFAILSLSNLAWGSGDKVKYFPESYNQSRFLFRKKAFEIKNKMNLVEVSYFKVPSQIDQDLTVDYLYIPAIEKPERLIILTSGVHGPEAYTGAALEFLFLDEYLKRTDLNSTGLLVIHSINPYGFKYHRRGTENNVNLNRNFEVSSDLFLNPNEGYLKLKTLMEPQGRVGLPALEFLDNSFNLLTRLIRGTSLDDLNEAIGMGQYSNARGLEYGGANFEPQVVFLEQILSRYMDRYFKILALDLHTGLGESGKLHLISGEVADREVSLRIEELFRSGQKQGSYILTNGDSDGFYHVHGDFVDFVTQLKSQSKQIIALTAEFGTVGNGILGKLQTVNRLILENQGHYFGYSNAKVEKEVKMKFLELFYPHDENWKANVLIQFRALLDRALLF